MNNGRRLTSGRVPIGAEAEIFSSVIKVSGGVKLRVESCGTRGDETPLCVLGMISEGIKVGLGGTSFRGIDASDVQDRAERKDAVESSEEPREAIEAQPYLPVLAKFARRSGRVLAGRAVPPIVNQIKLLEQEHV